MHACRLAIRNLCKSFAVPVLRDVTLDIAPGEIHAIVGENGAGKSTLVNILAGLLPADAGELYLDGDRYQPKNAREGFSAGVSFAAQELGLVDALNVAENIALRRLPHHWSILDRQVLATQASIALDKLGAGHIDSASALDHLSLADRQLVELAKAMGGSCRLLILDEPTAALTAQQAEIVHRQMSALAAGGTAVIFISHRLNEVLAVADTVTVLRDGEVASSVPASATSARRLMQEMTGKAATPGTGQRAETAAGRVLLDVHQLTTATLPTPVDFVCRSGEIVGLAGLAGAGKSELLQAMFGLQRLSGGRVVRHLDRAKVSIGNAHQAVLAGIGYLAEDRKSMGLYPGLSVLENLMIPGSPGFSGSFRWTRSRSEQQLSRQMIERLDIRCTGPDQPMTELSGGNQQKTLIGRWLRTDIDILLLDEPTRGVDIGTKNAIYELLSELRRQGMAIVVASSENEELMAISDRIVVLSNREPVAEFERARFAEEDILSAAFAGFASPARNSDEGLWR